MCECGGGGGPERGAGAARVVEHESKEDEWPVFIMGGGVVSHSFVVVSGIGRRRYVELSRMVAVLAGSWALGVTGSRMAEQG
jgi:predicted amino acid dehydrogenase